MIVQGTLDMLILKTLALEPMHGYGIAQRIEQVSQGVFSVNAGSLFPAFRRLEREGRIKAVWKPHKTTVERNITPLLLAAASNCSRKPTNGADKARPSPALWKRAEAICRSGASFPVA